MQEHSKCCTQRLLHVTNPRLNSCLLLLLSAGVTGLYFSQNEYIETVYVGQPAGTPVLQVHAMRDGDTERPHFYLCWMNSLRRPAHVSWFRLDISTGVLSLNKTLEESDFASLCELYTSRGTHCHTSYSSICNIFNPQFTNICSIAS